MQPDFAIIPARTERQAMDWSLVLVSQGIEAVIERDAEANRWLLVIHEPDYPRAVDALKRYLAENKTPRWQQTLPVVGMLFDWRVLGFLVFLILLFVMEASGRSNLHSAGLMDNHAVHAGQWWRLFTAVTLHGDVAHLAANVSTGLLMVGLAMGAYGYGVGLLTSYLAGVGGFLAGLIFLPETHRSLGASGLVLGALGLLAAQWVAYVRHGLTRKDLAARGILSGCLLLMLLGLSPQENVDVLAHVAGFVSGLLLGAALAFCPPKFVHAPWTNRCALALTLAFVLVPWWFALRHARV
jgi:membrane associated rhomboid family serine protease